VRRVGGIVVAFAEDAERVVRSGAAPLLRRPHHTLMIWSAPHVAIAFCGERGGLTKRDGAAAAVDGEILLGERVASGEEAALAVLDFYRRDDLVGLSGQFSGVIWDAATEEIVLVMDLLGTRPLYLVEREGIVFAASELKAVVAAGFEPRLDLDGAAQLLAYEHLLGATTLLADVRLLPPASTTVVSGAGVRTIDRARYRVAPEHTAGIADTVDTFSRLLDLAIVRRRDSRTALALSGGLDSRCIASIAGRRWPASRSFTFASLGTEEGNHAARVAAAAGLEHHILELQPGYVARGAAETVWLSEGQIRCFHAHHLVLRDVRSRFGVTSLLVGYAGDAVVRAGPMAAALDGRAHTASTRFADLLHERAAVAMRDALLERLLTRRFAGVLRGRARSSLNGVLTTLEGSDVARYIDYLVQEVYRRKVLPGAELFADDVIHRDPYVDSDLLRFLGRLPVQLRTELPLQRSYLRRFSELARVPNTKDGIAPNLDGWRRAVAGEVVRVRRWGDARLDTQLRRAGLLRRRGYSDYTSHLRNDSGRRLLELLLEERTLDRGQLRSDPVRKLVHETLGGSAEHTYVLGTLLTLELFQRHFVDADGPDSSGSFVRQSVRR